MLSECKSVLIPFYVSELNYFLQVEKDPKPVAEILMEIMTTMHCDRKLVSLQELFTLDAFMITKMIGIMDRAVPINREHS